MFSMRAFLRFGLPVVFLSFGLSVPEMVKDLACSDYSSFLLTFTTAGCPSIILGFFWAKYLRSKSDLVFDLITSFCLLGLLFGLTDDLEQVLASASIIAMASGLACTFLVATIQRCSKTGCTQNWTVPQKVDA